MQVTLRTRKPVDELAPEDLQTFPIWGFAEEEEIEENRDETWVRPVPMRTLPAGRSPVALAADFVTQQGESLPGLLWVDTENGAVITGGALFLAGRYTPIAQPGAALAEMLRRAAAAILGLHDQELFPLQYELSTMVEGDAVNRNGWFK